jgi:hypothetical protein
MENEKMNPQTIAEGLIAAGHPETAEALVVLENVPEVQSLLESVKLQFGLAGVETCKGGLLLGFHMGAKFATNGHL